MRDKKVTARELEAVWGRFLNLEGPVGFEPTTRGLKGRCSTN
jgi:hypothetical protein